MGKVFETLDEQLSSFLLAQPVFFVATAPAGAAGHVNLSPKGLDAFAVLGPRQVAYQDLVGSGAETLAHVRENGRITFMFCAFEGPPRIVRLHGRGEVLEPGDGGFEALLGRFPERPSIRSIVRADLDRIADSCGYGVPLMTYQGPRAQLGAWAERRGPEGLRAYQLENNAESIDGLPALRGERLRSG